MGILLRMGQGVGVGKTNVGGTWVVHSGQGVGVGVIYPVR